MDGASHLRIFTRILLPLSLPALASLVIFFSLQRYFVRGILAGSVKG